MIIKEHLGIPDFVASFIEQHYHNYRTTEVYIKEFYGLENMFSAEMYDELDEVIKEIIVYRIIKRECTVLNELVSIEQSLVEQFSDFIFKKHKTVKQIRFRKQFKSYKGHCIISYSNVSDFCIPLPSSKDEYDNSLGKKSLRNFKYYGRKLAKDLGDNLEIRVNETFNSSDVECLNDFTRLKDMKFAKEKNYIKKKKTEMLAKVAYQYGRISSVKLDGEIIGGWLRFVVGKECYEIILAYDIKYAHLNIVRVLLYQSIHDAIDKGCTADHLLWGANEFKNLVGAKEIELYDSYFYESRNLSYYLGSLSVKKELLILSMKKNKGIQYLRKFIGK